MADSVTVTDVESFEEYIDGIPKEFQFKHYNEDQDNTYTAKYRDENDEFIVSWTNSEGKYSELTYKLEIVNHWIKEGHWLYWPPF